MNDSHNIGHKWASDFSVDPAEVEAEFDAEAVIYDQNLKKWDYRVPQDATALLSEYVPSTAAVLDAGCGTGMVGEVLKDRGFDILTGCDLSNGMLDVARSSGFYGKLDQADLCQRLPYEDSIFDAVICLATLSFIVDAEETFREFCRVSRRDAIILFSHRCDLFEERNCLELCQQLEHESLWKRETHSDPQLYIPGHPSYTDQLKVAYFVYRVQ